jgi:hypothetical protein
MDQMHSRYQGHPMWASKRASKTHDHRRYIEYMREQRKKP